MPSFEAEQHICDSPSIVDIAYDVIFRGFGVGKEDFVEVMTVTDIDNGSAVHPILVHGNQQE
tara:strand:- start:102 stop:287 length:186 start_codon:yes stop_codon:yes gene_type:complete